MKLKIVFLIVAVFFMASCGNKGDLTKPVEKIKADV
ncbi:MAG: lipoprotein [Proteobacteria bacterium]|nr:lipoprotein [Pseudomonadota bacterium]